MKRSTKRKAILLSLTMALLLLTPVFSYAQERGLFGYGYYYGSYDNNLGMTNHGLKNIYNGWEFGFINQTFGETPVGSGIIVMLVAGAGYLLIKKKED